MTSESTPYEVPLNSSHPGIPFGTKLTAGFVGVLVFAGSAATLGMFMVGLLVLSAGKRQPSPVESDALLQGAQQQLVASIGGVISLGISIWLAAYVVMKILRSQQLVADVAMRRQELQAIVLQMHAAVQQDKKKSGPKNAVE